MIHFLDVYKRQVVFRQERLCQNDWTGILNEKGKGKWNEKDEIDKIGEILGFI